MKTTTSNLASIVGAAIAITSLSVEATTNWSFGDSGANNGIVSAYSAANNNTSGDPNRNNVIGNLAATSLTSWSGGLGAGGESAPAHAVDNAFATEALLLSLGGSYNLTQFSLGYALHKTSSTSESYAAGADVSVFAYTGTNPPALTGQSFTGLLAAYNSGLNTGGWQLIGNYANVTSTQAVSTPTSSSYWLIAAYNSVFGSCATCSNAQGKSGYKNTDYFKLSGLAAESGGGTGGGGGSGSVPEPSPMALLGTALLGAIALRRRQNSGAN